MKSGKEDKIDVDLVPAMLPKHVKENVDKVKNVVGATTDNFLAIALPKVNTEKHGIRTFRYRGAKIWTMLPNYEKMQASTDVF